MVLRAMGAASFLAAGCSWRVPARLRRPDQPGHVAMTARLLESARVFAGLVPEG